jgi:TPR repeat protein
MAAKLGNMDAHYKVADLYHEGKGVGKDLKKRIYHL